MTTPDPVRAAAEALVEEYTSRGGDYVTIRGEHYDALRTALRAPPQGDAPRKVLAARKVLTYLHQAVDPAMATEIRRRVEEAFTALAAPPAPQGDAAPLREEALRSLAELDIASDRGVAWTRQRVDFIRRALAASSRPEAQDARRVELSDAEADTLHALARALIDSDTAGKLAKHVIDWVLSRRIRALADAPPPQPPPPVQRSGTRLISVTLSAASTPASPTPRMPTGAKVSLDFTCFACKQPLHGDDDCPPGASPTPQDERPRGPDGRDLACDDEHDYGASPTGDARPCPECDGSGCGPEMMAGDWKRCGICGGTGKRPPAPPAATTTTKEE